MRVQAAMRIQATAMRVQAAWGFNAMHRRLGGNASLRYGDANPAVMGFDVMDRR
jgi:hypothetical protein